MGTCGGTSTYVPYNQFTFNPERREKRTRPSPKSERDKRNSHKKTETKRDLHQDEKLFAWSTFGEERLFEIRDLPLLPSSMQNIIDIYRQQYASRFSNLKPPAIFASALARLHHLQQEHSDAELTQLLKLFFACDLAHIKRQRHSLEAFVHNFNILQEVEGIRTK